MRKRKKKSRNKRIKKVIPIAILIFIIIIIINVCKSKSNKENQENAIEVSENSEPIENQPMTEEPKIPKKLEWNLTLVNSENRIPEDYQLELEKIDQYREFDSRAIEYLNDMLNAIKKDGITNIWVQSAYRSVEEQETVYNKKVKEYISKGKTQEEAQNLTEKVINKPGYSEHNLGLAVDFNYVETKFEETKAFQWLTENAEEYGFVLRYPEEKKEITKVDYEPWHWRYVGKEDAKKMNELEMCLEEYIEYLNNENYKI